MRKRKLRLVDVLIMLVMLFAMFSNNLILQAAADPATTSDSGPHIYHPVQWYDEQRQVSGFGSTDNLIHGSGPVMHTVQVFAIYWDPNNTITASYQNLVNRFFQDIGGTRFYNIVTQYNDTPFPAGGAQNVVSLGGTWVDTSNAYPHAGTGADPLVDQNIRDEIDRALVANSGWGDPDLTKMFFVFTENGIESCSASDSCTIGVPNPPADPTKGYCAYHWNYTNSGHDVIYANMPYVATWDSGFSFSCTNGGVMPNSNHDADEEISTTSHELFEAATDAKPNNNWTENNCPPPSSVGNCGEIGDKCAYLYGTQATDGHNVVLNGNPYTVQEEWSNAANDGVTAYSGCVFSYNANVDVGTNKSGSPNTVIAGQNITYTITVTNSDTTFEATDVKMTDPLPSGTTFVSLTSPAGWSCTTPAVGFSGSVNCTTLSIPSSGSASFTLVVKVVNTVPAGTTFTNTASVTSTSGDPNGSNDSASVVTAMLRPTMLVYTGDTSQDYHDAATVSFVLEDALLGTPIAGKSVDLSLGTQTATVTTDASGVASASIVITQIPGPSMVSASFAGDSEYVDSTASEPFTITREETTVTYTGDTLIANGQPVHLKGVLLEDGAVAISGRLLSFTLGSGASAQTCSGTTDVTGTASCVINVAAQPLGPGQVGVDFAGDAYYLPSSNSAATIVFAFLDQGSFVVGNNSASGTVTFWGSKWSSTNSLTGGAAPNAFKGFASTISTTPPACGSSWTTKTGNSSVPPVPGAVPSYMGVVVASGVTSTGSVIAGNSVSIVIVHTDPGYLNDPGHPGTGTVVAVYCHP